MDLKFTASDHPDLANVSLKQVVIKLYDIVKRLKAEQKTTHKKVVSIAQGVKEFSSLETEQQARNSTKESLQEVRETIQTEVDSVEVLQKIRRHCIQQKEMFESDKENYRFPDALRQQMLRVSSAFLTPTPKKQPEDSGNKCGHRQHLLNVKNALLKLVNCFHKESPVSMSGPHYHLKVHLVSRWFYELLFPGIQRTMRNDFEFREKFISVKGASRLN